MSDTTDRFEAELAAMRPRALPAELFERIEADLAEPATHSRWPDRFLLSAIGSGAIAACVIVTMLLKPTTNAFPSPPTAVMTAPSDPPRAGDFSLAAANYAAFDL